MKNKFHTELFSPLLAGGDTSGGNSALLNDKKKI